MIDLKSELPRLMPERISSRGTLVALFGLLILSACAEAKPSRHYILNSLTPTELAQDSISKGRGVSIGLEQIGMPEFLDRPEIVLHGGGNKLELGEFDRWAEPLDRNIERVVAENLSVLLGSDRIFILPARRRLDLRYRVEIDIIRFDLVKEGEVRLQVRWAVLDGQGEHELMIATSSLERPVSAQDFDGVVSSMNENLTDLSREIVAAISSLENGPRS